MTKTLVAIYDGETLRPAGPVDLKFNTRYIVTIEREAEQLASNPLDNYPLTEIFQLATDMGMSDLSARHNMYAHGRIAADEPSSQS